MLGLCHHCQKPIRNTLLGRSRRVTFKMHDYCNFDCLEEWQEDQRRVQESERPINGEPRLPLFDE